MEIIGTVIDTDEKLARVLVKRTSACGENCANCHGACESTTVESTAENKKGARVGDVVKIESNDKDVVRAAMFLYIVPILFSIIMATLVYAIGVADIFVIIISVASFFASFVGIKHFEKKIVPKAYITKIIKRA